MNHPLSDMMTNTMSKIKDMIDVNTVIGDPIVTDGGVTIIPVTKVSIGYGSGGRTIGKILSEKLGIPFYDRELLYMASEESGINWCVSTSVIPCPSAPYSPLVGS